MTLAIWPAELPAPQRQGFQHASGDGRLRTRNDAGPKNVRRRFSATADAVALELMLTRAELARFDRWYAEEIAEGSLPFLMPDPGTDGWALLTDEGAPLLTDEGVPILLCETWLCLMGDQLPARSIVKGRWRLAFDVAVMP